MKGGKCKIVDGQIFEKSGKSWALGEADLSWYFTFAWWTEGVLELAIGKFQGLLKAYTGYDIKTFWDQE